MKTTLHCPTVKIPGDKEFMVNLEENLYFENPLKFNTVSLK